jgi:hypothetical protein
MYQAIAAVEGGLRSAESDWAGGVWGGVCCANVEHKQHLCNENTQQVGNVESKMNKFQVILRHNNNFLNFYSVRRQLAFVKKETS